MVNNFDPQNVIQSVWGTKAISVQLTDQVGWNSFRIFGYIVGGKDIFLVYLYFFGSNCSNMGHSKILYKRVLKIFLPTFCHMACPKFHKPKG